MEMQKVVVFVSAAVGSFVAVSSFGAGSDGASVDWGDAQMRGCLRQMEQLVPGEAEAVSACKCTFEEFEAAGLSLGDALGSEFDEMSRITRSCAAKNGAQLP